MNLLQRDKAVIWHPYTSLQSPLDPLPVVRGEGVYLIDEQGRQYLDAISSWWVTLHGHGNHYIAERIFEQAKLLEQVIFAGFTHQPAIELAERLLGLLPGNFSRIFYSDNGSTAVEVALKMALQYWQNLQGNPGTSGLRPQKRNRILALNHSYHGDTFGTMSVSERGLFNQAFREQLFDVTYIDPPTAENLEALVAPLHSNPEQWAAFIYEPLVQGAGGMKMHEPEALDRLLKSMKKAGILCIADEVMTGFGRTGKLFASCYLEETADIICLSKGLTGGTMALGATAVNEKIVLAFSSPDKMKTFYHGHSFTANPLACTAALASLDLLESESCQNQLAEICDWQSRFCGLLKEWEGKNLLKNIRCRGTILAFEISQGADSYLNDLGRRISSQALEKGVLLRPLGNTLYLMPPYCITRQELARVHAVILEILQGLLPSN